jgi:CheY-like chemotaxis protein
MTRRARSTSSRAASRPKNSSKSGERYAATFVPPPSSAAHAWPEPPIGLPVVPQAQRHGARAKQCWRVPKTTDGRLRVVVADDNDRLRNALVTFLQGHFEVIAAVSTGRDLVKATLDLNPDVVVSDVFMPSLTGPAALQQIRRAGNDVPFVLVTAHVLNVAAWLGFGAHAIVDKRDLHSDLVSAVRGRRGADLSVTARRVRALSLALSSCVLFGQESLGGRTGC